MKCSWNCHSANVFRQISCLSNKRQQIADWKRPFYAPDESSSIFSWTCVFLLTPWQRRVGVCLNDGCVHRVSVALPTATNHPYAPVPSFIPQNCLSDCPKTAQSTHMCSHSAYLSRDRLCSRLSLKGQRSLIMYRQKSRIIINTVNNSEKLTGPREVPLSTSHQILK